MRSTTRTAWLPFLATAALAACSDPVRPVAPETDTTPSTLADLTATSVQTITQFSGERGGTYAAAPIVSANLAYSIIPGTRYISNAPNSVGPVSGSMWYET